MTVAAIAHTRNAIAEPTAAPITNSCRSVMILHNDECVQVCWRQTSFGLRLQAQSTLQDRTPRCMWTCSGPRAFPREASARAGDGRRQGLSSTWPPQQRILPVCIPCFWPQRMWRSKAHLQLAVVTVVLRLTVRCQVLVNSQLTPALLMHMTYSNRLVWPQQCGLLLYSVDYLYAPAVVNSEVRSTCTRTRW